MMPLSCPSRALRRPLWGFDDAVDPTLHDRVIRGAVFRCHKVAGWPNRFRTQKIEME